MTGHDSTVLGQERRLTVAVVIVCHNQAEFLADAVTSALGQTRLPDEIIVIDDGSTDDTRHVVDQFPATDYVYQTNQGLSAARNTGLHRATTDLVVFLDADDRLRANAVDAGLACFSQHSEAAFVSGGHVRIDVRGQLLESPTPPAIAPGEHYVRLLRDNYVGMHATVMYRRQSLVAIGGFDVELTSCEDYDVYLRLARTAPSATHPEVVAEYRTYPGTMSANARRMYRNVQAARAKQRPHIVGDPAREAAFADGEAFWMDLYGVSALELSIADVAGGRIVRGLRDLAEVHRAAPELARPVTRRAARDQAAWKRAVVTDRVRRLAGRPADTPLFGHARLGDLRRTVPISRQFGFDRGQPVDRHYIEQFLDDHRSDIRGRVLEIGDSTYTYRFGGGGVETAEYLHVSDPDAHYRGDLTDCPQVPDNRFDCAVITQTLHLIYDIDKALATLHRILRPGGVLLVTVPGISQISDDQWSENWYWSFTDQSLRRALGDRFTPAAVEVDSFGNVLTATAFLYGLAAGELTDDELATRDPLYQAVVCGRAVKSVVDGEVGGP